jgi:hypothetical protein
MARPLAAPWPQTDVVLIEVQLTTSRPDYLPAMRLQAYRNEDAASADYLPVRFPVIWYYDADRVAKTPPVEVKKHREWRNGDFLDAYVAEDYPSRQIGLAALKLKFHQEKIIRGFLADPAEDEAMTVQVLASTAATSDITFDVVVLFLGYRYGVSIVPGQEVFPLVRENYLFVEVFDHNTQTWVDDLVNERGATPNIYWGKNVRVRGANLLWFLVRRNYASASGRYNFRVRSNIDGTFATQLTPTVNQP